MSADRSMRNKTENNETDCENPPHDLEHDASASDKSAPPVKTVNLDARRKVEIYLERRDLEKKLVDLDEYLK